MDAERLRLHSHAERGNDHLNPVKRGYVDTPEHWRYSSARNYAGLEGLIEIDRWD